MDSARWKQIQAVFHDAADLPQPEQLAFVAAACDGDDKLMSEVQAMLEQDAAGQSMLDRGLAEVVHQTFVKAGPSALGPKEFGPYRVVRLLGEGGMGVVYLAERADLDTQVAVKILRDAWVSPARRERFASEQRTLAQLNHPSIARLYDADSLEDGTPWFVMEYVNGLPLTQYCREQSSSIEERLQLFRLVCEAVQHAHGHAVIHRDLKPSNILVKSDGTLRLARFRNCQAGGESRSSSRSDDDWIEIDDARLCGTRANSGGSRWDQHRRLFSRCHSLRAVKWAASVRLVEPYTRRSRQCDRGT